MKAVISTILFLSLLLFTDTKMPLLKGELVDLNYREQEINRGLVLFDSLIMRGVQMDIEADSIKVLIDRAEYKVKFLKTKNNEK